MKKIVNIGKEDAINFDEKILYNSPIFVKKDNKLCGMVVYNQHGRRKYQGWSVKIGAMSGAYGIWSSLKSCMEAGTRNGYEFFVE